MGVPALAANSALENRTIADIEKSLQMPVFATLANDYESVIASINTSKPVILSGKSPYAKSIRQLVDRVLGGSTDNEFCKLAWRRDHGDLNKLPIWSFADNGGAFARQLGILDEANGVALRATFIVDPDNVIQHVSVNNLNVGRNPDEVLRILDGLQTDELCPCNRTVGGATL